MWLSPSSLLTALNHQATSIWRTGDAIVLCQTGVVAVHLKALFGICWHNNLLTCSMVTTQAILFFLLFSYHINLFYFLNERSINSHSLLWQTSIKIHLTFKSACCVCFVGPASHITHNDRTLWS